VFHQFRQAKFADGGSILGSSQFWVLLQLPLKMTLAKKEAKIQFKKILLLF
jgi:hypothetical protein